MKKVTPKQVLRTIKKAQLGGFQSTPWQMLQVTADSTLAQAVKMIEDVLYEGLIKFTLTPKGEEFLEGK
jgi:hypothetical protein